MSTTGEPKSQREAAVASLKAKRSFQISLAVYLVVNAFLILVWLFTRDSDDGGGFWPVWTIGFWGVGVAIQGWHAYGPPHRGITEDQIQKEMQRLDGAG